LAAANRKPENAGQILTPSIPGLILNDHQRVFCSCNPVKDLAMYPDAIVPDLDLGGVIETQADAHSRLCWTCGTCDAECPVFRATGRLQPQKTVRMANLGLKKSLLSLPEIWYCLYCRRCLQGCPNSVKPFELHRYLRDEAIAAGIVSPEIMAPYRRLFSEFQRVRWRAVAHCFKADLTSLTSDQWYKWLKTPLRDSRFRVVKPASGSNGRRTSTAPGNCNGQACITCGECSGSCPLMGERAVFDPQHIIRMTTLSMSAELLRSPSLWLCLQCQQCTVSCSQLVRGHDIIRQFQEMAVAEGIVDDQFLDRLTAADRIIYPQFLNEIDALIGMFSGSSTTTR
jgi:heterodisulfide reductase subunit C